MSFREISVLVETPNPKAKISFAVADREANKDSPSRVHRRKRESKVDFDAKIKKKETVIEDLEGGDFFDDGEELSGISGGLCQQKNVDSNFGIKANGSSKKKSGGKFKKQMTVKAPSWEVRETLCVNLSSALGQLTGGLGLGMLVGNSQMIGGEEMRGLGGDKEIEEMKKRATRTTISPTGKKRTLAPEVLDAQETARISNTGGYGRTPTVRADGVGVLIPGQFGFPNMHGMGANSEMDELRKSARRTTKAALGRLGIIPQSDGLEVLRRPSRIALDAQALATPGDADDGTDFSSCSEESNISEPGSSKVEGTNLDEVKGFAFGAPEQTAPIKGDGFEIKVVGCSHKTIDADGARDRSQSEAWTKPEP